MARARRRRQPLAANLTSQVRPIAKVTEAVVLSGLPKQIEVDYSGEILDLNNTVNGTAIWLQVLTTEVTLEVGSWGKLGVEGVWEQVTSDPDIM